LGERGSARTFPVLPGDFVRLALEPRVTVAGRVLLPSGDAAAGARVRLAPRDPLMWERLALYRMPEWRAETRADDDGRFELPFEPGYRPGPVWYPLTRVVAELPDGHGGQSVTFVRPTHAAQALEIVLAPPRRLSVIADRSLAPLDGALVFDASAPDAGDTSDA